jgi:single-strand DNA-binding protein
VARQPPLLHGCQFIQRRVVDMLNLVCINGRMAGDPESGQSQQGVAYATIPVAVERGQGENKQVTYLDCVAFRQQADFVSKYFNKGDAINLVGSISVRDWQDRNGIKHRKFEIVVNEVSFPASGRRQKQGKSNGDRDRVPAGVASEEPGPKYEF